MSTPARRSTGDRLTQILLACGVIHGTLYIILNDVVAAGLYEGYDPLSQAVSELSATWARPRTPSSPPSSPSGRC